MTIELQSTFVATVISNSDLEQALGWQVMRVIYKYVE